MGQRQPETETGLEVERQPQRQKRPGGPADTSPVPVPRVPGFPPRGALGTDPSGNQLRATLPQLTLHGEEAEGGSKALAAQLLSTLEGHKSAGALPSLPPGGGGSLGSLGLALAVPLPP